MALQARAKAALQKVVLAAVLPARRKVVLQKAALVAVLLDRRKAVLLALESNQG